MKRFKTTTIKIIAINKEVPVKFRSFNKSAPPTASTVPRFVQLKSAVNWPAAKQKAIKEPMEDIAFEKHFDKSFSLFSAPVVKP